MSDGVSSETASGTLEVVNGRTKRKAGKKPLDPMRAASDDFTLFLRDHMGLMKKALYQMATGATTVPDVLKKSAGGALDDLAAAWQESLGAYDIEALHKAARKQPPPPGQLGLFDDLDSLIEQLAPKAPAATPKAAPPSHATKPAPAATPAPATTPMPAGDPMDWPEPDPAIGEDAWLAHRERQYLARLRHVGNNVQANRIEADPGRYLKTQREGWRNEYQRNATETAPQPVENPPPPPAPVFDWERDMQLDSESVGSHGGDVMEWSGTLNGKPLKVTTIAHDGDQINLHTDRAITVEEADQLRTALADLDDRPVAFNPPNDPEFERLHPRDAKGRFATHREQAAKLVSTDHADFDRSLEAAESPPPAPPQSPADDPATIVPDPAEAAAALAELGVTGEPPAPEAPVPTVTDEPPHITKTYADMTLDEVKGIVDACTDMLSGRTFYEGANMAKDGIGFNAADMALVKGMARLGLWGDGEYAMLANVLAKYKRQIEGQLGEGHYQVIRSFLDSVQADDTAGETSALSLAGGTRWVDGEGNVTAESPEVRIFASTTTTLPYRIAYGFNRETNARIKSLAGRGHYHWNGDTKEWSLTAQGAERVLAGMPWAAIDFNSHQHLSAASMAEVEAERTDAEELAALKAKQQAEARMLTDGEMPGDDEWVNRLLQVYSAKPLMSVTTEPGSSRLAVHFPGDKNKDLLEMFKSAVPTRRWEGKNDPSKKYWTILPRDLPKLLTTFPEAGMGREVFEQYGYLLTKTDEELADKDALLKLPDENNTDFEHPKGWTAFTLHDYQKKGANWLLEVKKGILGYGVGLGKTAVTIAAASRLQETRQQPFICVVPGKRLYGWRKDILEVMPDKKVLVLDDSPATKTAMLTNAQDYDFIVCTYDAIEGYGAQMKAANPLGVIYDEAHWLKSKKAKRTKASKAHFGDLEYVWDLTATPLPNKPEELRDLIQRNHPDALPPDEFYSLCTYEKGWGGRKQVTGYRDAAALRKALKPYLFVKRSSDADVNLALPELRQSREAIDMEPHQDVIYQRAKNDIITFLESVGQDSIAAHRAEILVMFGKVEQIAISPELVDPSYTRRSPKIQAMVDEITAHQAEYKDKGSVVFCRFAKALDIARRELLVENNWTADQIKIIDGQTKKSDVEKYERMLNDGTIKVLLCSDAAKEGLNFQKGSNHLIHLDTPWSPYMTEQRNGRVYRQGQKAPVRIVTLASSGMDAHKWALHQKKAALDESLFEGERNDEQALDGKMGKDDYLRVVEGL